MDDNTFADPKKLFQNFQKEGKIVPNITSNAKRPAGISKGLWKKELKFQMTGKVDKRHRSGKREPKKPEKMLGKRDHKTATLHATNTSTFKNQAKKRQKKE